MAQPPLPPETQEKVKAAQKKAAAAKTPAQVEDAKADVKAAAKEVASAAEPNFFKREAFLGIPWWGVFVSTKIAHLKIHHYSSYMTSSGAGSLVSVRTILALIINYIVYTITVHFAGKSTKI